MCEYSILNLRSVFIQIGLSCLMKIHKSTLPLGSLLTQYPSDYLDSYSAKVSLQNIQSIDVVKAFFQSSPKWIDQLFQLRNRIVRIFGLKTGDEPHSRQELLDNFNGQPGEVLGLFRVYQAQEQEMILGEDDRHLNFKISFHVLHDGSSNLRGSVITFTTIVEFNNVFGRFYFWVIKPFHKIIVSSMLRSTIQELEKVKN